MIAFIAYTHRVFGYPFVNEWLKDWFLSYNTQVIYMYSNGKDQLLVVKQKVKCWIKLGLSGGKAYNKTMEVFVPLSWPLLRMIYTSSY